MYLLIVVISPGECFVLHLHAELHSPSLLESWSVVHSTELDGCGEGQGWYLAFMTEPGFVSTHSKKDKSRQFFSLIGLAGTHMGTQCQRTFLRKSTNLGDCNFAPVLFWFQFFPVLNGSQVQIQVLVQSKKVYLSRQIIDLGSSFRNKNQHITTRNNKVQQSCNRPPLD